MPTEQTLWPENQAGGLGLGLIMGGKGGSGPPPPSGPFFIELEDGSGFVATEDGTGLVETEAQ